MTPTLKMIFDFQNNFDSENNFKFKKNIHFEMNFYLNVFRENSTFFSRILVLASAGAREGQKLTFYFHLLQIQGNGGDHSTPYLEKWHWD